MRRSTILAGALAGLLSCAGGAPAQESRPALTQVLCEGLDVPESVLHDPRWDRYLISCVGGKPGEQDGNGQVVALDPKTNQVQPWARGLDAPKGLALLEDLVIVSDIVRVVALDRGNGRVVGELALEGARFLNDVAAHPDAPRVAVSDTATGTIHILEVERSPSGAGFREGPRLTGLPAPNGLAWRDPGVLLCLSASKGTLHELTLQGSRRTRGLSVPTQALDGLVLTGLHWVASDHRAGTVLVIDPPTPREDPDPLLAEVRWRDLTTPADLGVDRKRQRLLIPSFRGGRLLAAPLPH